MLGSSLIASSASVYGHVELSLFPEVHQSNCWILPTDSSRIGREQHVPKSSNRSLYLIKLRRSSYFEGNFGWNQRLDSSISLPPLHPSVTNDLRVNSVTASTRVSLEDALLMYVSPSFGFVSLRPVSNHFQDHGQLQKHTSRHSLPSRLQVEHQKTCTHVDSLVRDSIRFERDHVVTNERQERKKSNALSLQTLGF